MKKYLPYILIIVALGGAAAWYLLRQSPDAIKRREGEFAVKNEKDITRIVIDGSENRHIELSNTNGIWMVNGKYAARENLVELLLQAVTRVTSLTPVPAAAHDNVLRDMMEKKLHVQVFTNNAQKPEKSYWVGGATIDNQGTYMLLEMDGKNASRPHIVYVPGARSYLTPRFELDPEVWRSRVVFNYTPQEIKTLKVEYTQAPENSFILNQVTADSFTVAPVDEQYTINETYRQKHIQQYLGFYSSISIEAYENSFSQKDSIIQTNPYCTLTITETDGTVNQVKLFYMPISKRTKARYDVYGRAFTHDQERYYATVHNGNDFAIVQYYVFGNLLRSYKDFFFKPTAQ